MTLILGIDEAGRGPVIGPLMMCGYLIEERKLEKLKSIGVKDSKLLTAEKRTAMFPEIRDIADDYVVTKIPAHEIDKLRDISNLNKIEISRMQEIINLLPADKVVIDSPEVNTGKFSEKIRAKLKNKSAHIVCENYADKKYIEVGAASIMAKVHRDREIEKLHKKHGFFGSGYTHDERTIRFLKDWIKVNKEFPPFVRKSWITAILIKEEMQQKKIMEFTERKNVA